MYTLYEFSRKLSFVVWKSRHVTFVVLQVEWMKRAGKALLLLCRSLDWRHRGSRFVVAQMYYNYVSSYFMHVIAFFPKWNSKSVAYLFEDALELAPQVKLKLWNIKLFPTDFSNWQVTKNVNSPHTIHTLKNLGEEQRSNMTKEMMVKQ